VTYDIWHYLEQQQFLIKSVKVGEKQQFSTVFNYTVVTYAHKKDDVRRSTATQKGNPSLLSSLRCNF
jgi:hypothetical protein